MGLMSFWVLLHSVIWGGEAERSEDLPFPFNVMALLLGSDSTVSGKSPNSRIDDGQDLAFDRNAENLYFGQKTGLAHVPAQEKLNGDSISKISINGLFNFLTVPRTVAGNLFLALGFVSFYPFFKRFKFSRHFRKQKYFDAIFLVFKYTYFYNKAHKHVLCFFRARLACWSGCCHPSSGPGHRVTKVTPLIRMTETRISALKSPPGSGPSWATWRTTRPSSRFTTE